MTIRLRTAFLLASLAGLGLLLLGVWAFTDGLARVTRITEVQQVAGAITGDGRRLALLSHDLGAHEVNERRREQWLTLRDSLTQNIATHPDSLRPFRRETERIEYQLEVLEPRLRAYLDHRTGPKPRDVEADALMAMQLNLRIAELRSALDELEAAVQRFIKVELGASGEGLVARFFLLFGLYFLAGVAAWAFFFLRMQRPLAALEDGIRRIHAGDTGFRPVKAAADEIGAVVEAFNEMQDRQQALTRDLAAKNRLFDIIGRFKEHYIRDPDPTRLFETLLRDLLPLTGSEFGLIGDVLRDDAGRDYLKCNAFHDIARDMAARRHYAEHKATGFVIRAQDTLLGEVIRERALVIANDAEQDGRGLGLPPGQPELRAFLGIPVWYGERLVGVIGLANRPGGYDRALVDQIQPLVDACGRIIVSRRELVARKQAEAGLREYKEHLEELVQARTAELEMANLRLTQTQFAMDRAGIAIHWADAHSGRLLYVNDHACAMLGYSAEEMLAMSVPDIDPGFPAGQFEALTQPLRERGYDRFETRNRRKDGQLIEVEVTLYFQPAEAGRKDARFITFITDISQRKHAELALREAKNAAEAANRAKSVFLANMSHELRTPLNAILGFAQLLERDERIPEDERKNIATINRSGRHLLTLINDVLEITHIEAGRAGTVHAVFDLPGLLTAIEETNRPRAEARNLEFALEYPADLPTHVLGDARHLQHVLANLLGNAIKYTEHGHVRLRVGVVSAERIRFEVSDSGPGIPEAERERVFHAFHQTEVGIAKGEGTGLGLAISREFVRLMGGELTLDDAPGQGSRFMFSVPLPTADASPALPVAEAARGNRADAPTTASASDLSGLPAAQRQALAAAAATLDTEATLTLVEQLRQNHPDEAELIARLAEAYRFDQIEALCQ